MGIIGNSSSTFKPYETVNKAEFGTMLARILWGTKYDGGVPYYQAPLNALKNAGIMTQPPNAETTQETKGSIFAMLLNADKVINNDKYICSEPLILLACSLKTSECPTECATTNKNTTTTISNITHNVN
jgi:hypothetical protein